MPSSDSSTDPCKCRHTRGQHAEGLCLGCKDEDLGVLARHGFIGPEAEPPVEGHKWKPCPGCGHPQHAMRCRELSTRNDVDECGCTACSDAQSIADTCRKAGGCPEHPKEPYCPPACTEGHTYSGSCARRADGPIGAPEKDCLFCHMGESRIMAQNKTFYARYDNFPATPGHVEIVPKRHVESFFALGEAELADMYRLTVDATKELGEKYSPDGYTIGVNEGRAAGRTIDHLHIHLIPRRHGDVPDPRGGIRRSLPNADPDQWAESQEPPPTPEEGPQCKFPQGCHRVVPCAPGCGASWEEAAPPQPLRRPPYAVAYSADGHLYEVMLPGDAIVSAVDGALVIKHAQFMIHGIVAVHPIESKEQG